MTPCLLVVEDDRELMRLLRLSLVDIGGLAMHPCYDGAGALTALDGGLNPDLALLDLNLPKLDGKQVLAQLKNAPDLRRIPVIILSSSRADQDITDSYDRHANGYITKPDEFGRMRDVVEAIEEFWFGAATLPARH